MNDNQAIKIIKEVACGEGCKPSICNDSCLHGEGECAFGRAVKALEEIQEYRKNGTPEECLENAFVADYVRKNHPEIFDMAEYQKLRLIAALREVRDSVKEAAFDSAAQALANLFNSNQGGKNDGKAD